MKAPSILTIAGSDPSGGAGIQADLKAVSANGGYGAAVITALTVQNSLGVSRVEPVSAEMVEGQLVAVFSDLEVAACKTGMLANREIVETVARILEKRRPRKYVCDPVMSASSGPELLPPGCLDLLRSRIFPLASLITPNVPEAQILSGVEIGDTDSAAEAAERLMEQGARAVLIKGGHLRGKVCTDLLMTGSGVRRYEGERIETVHTHGTGCTYSAAIATQLGRGLELHEAVSMAKEFMTASIRSGFPVGAGPGPTDQFFFMRHGQAAGDWLSRLVETEKE